jgi:integrase/recombinase XerD
MTKLRQEMIRAMELRNLSHHTQRTYLAAVKGIAHHYQRSPDKLSKEMIEDYLLYLKKEKGNAPNSCGTVLTGLRFFYNHVAKQEIPIEYRQSKKVRRLPTILTQEEVWAIINAPCHSQK